METLCLWPLEGHKHDFRKVKGKYLTYLASDSYTEGEEQNREEEEMAQTKLGGGRNRGEK